MSNLRGNNLYFDVAATTPLDVEVIEEMNRINRNNFGNPSSIHQFGQQAHNVLERSRKNISKLLSCHESEIYFTSGGTESNNLALKGILKADNHLITTSYEHPAVLKVAKELMKEGVNATFLKPNQNGIIDPIELKKAITPKTKLVSIMHVNNELGTINPIADIGEICKDSGILFHTDAVQYIGKGPLNLSTTPVDLLSIGAHKFYGPKGIGILFAKRGISMKPLLIGGGQEKGLSPGTENISLIAGMSKALDIAYNKMIENSEHIKGMEQKFIHSLNDSNINYKINGFPRLSGIINVTFNDIDGHDLLMNLDLRGIAISFGSACASGSAKASSALLETGMLKEDAKKTVRISIGKFIKKKDIDTLIDNLKKIIPCSKPKGEIIEQ